MRLSRSSVECEVIKAKAVDLLKTMLAYDYSATLLGGMLLQASPDQQAMSLVLEDTFRRKASSTVYKRVRAYWRYYCWARQERGMEKQALVPSEESLYRYLSAMRESGRGATSGESFVQSVIFCMPWTQGGGLRHVLQETTTVSSEAVGEHGDLSTLQKRWE